MANLTPPPTRTTFAVVERTRPGRPGVWTLDPQAPLGAGPLPADGLGERAEAAIATRDRSSLLIVLAEAVELGHHRTSGQVARTALDHSMRELPGISAERLAALAIAGSVAVDGDVVADLATVAHQLRTSALMFQAAGLFESRRDPGTIAVSVDKAVERAEGLAAMLETLAAGRSLALVPLIRQLSFFGLLNIARGLARIATDARGSASLEVSIGAQIRRTVGPGRALSAQLEVLSEEPGNTAARNSACACLVDLGMAEAGLDHLAISLLTPDRYVGNTGRRALREAGYRRQSQMADEIAALMANRYPEEATPEVKRLAANILVGIGRRVPTELAMLDLTATMAPERIFRGRAIADAIPAGVSR